MTLTLYPGVGKKVGVQRAVWPVIIILKTDRRGWVRTPSAQRQQLLEAFAQSGMSAAEFAAQVGVKYPTFAAWVQRRRRAQGMILGAILGVKRFWGRFGGQLCTLDKK